MIFRPLLCIALFSLAGAAQAANPLCQQKEQDIQKEIAHAKQHDNSRRVTGLERALSEVRGTCTDEALKKGHAEKISRQEQDVAERENDLHEAQTDGDHDKISKREKKLAEAKEELATLKAQPY